MRCTFCRLSAYWGKVCECLGVHSRPISRSCSTSNPYIMKLWEAGTLLEGFAKAKPIVVYIAALGDRKPPINPLRAGCKSV